MLQRGEADPRSPQYPEDPPVPVPRKLHGNRKPRGSRAMSSAVSFLLCLRRPQSRCLQEQTSCGGSSGRPLQVQGPHTFSPGCALVGVSGCRVLLAVGRLPMENRHEEPRPVSVLQANRALIFYVLRLKITSRSGGTWALTRRESPTSLCPRLTLVMRI